MSKESFKMGDRVRYYEGEPRDAGTIRYIDERRKRYTVTWDENPEFNDQTFDISELVPERPADDR